MQETVSQIIQLLESGRPHEAVPLCAALQAQAPDHPGVRQLAMAVAAESGHLDDARVHYEALRELVDDNPELHYNYGRALLKGGALEAASRALIEALERAPTHIQALNNLGVSEQRQGHLEAAEKAFEQALAIAPDYTGAKTNLAHLRLEQGEVDEAIRLLREVLAAEPDNAQVRYGLGLALQAAERHQESADHLRQAVSRLPDPADAWNALGISLNAMGLFAAALDAYEQALALQPEDPGVLNNLANCLVNSGEDLERAKATYLRALELEESAQFHANLATVCELANETDEARQAATRALGLDGENVAAQLVLARLERRAGEYAQAQQRLLAMNDERMVLRERKERAFELGQVLDKLGDADAAFEQFTRGNQWALDWWLAQGQQPAPFAREVEDIRTITVGLPPPAATPVADAPVFLLGFQRSGNTLLDTVLDAHGAFAVLEEKPVLSRVIAALDYPRDLVRLDDAERDRLRAVYHAGVRDELGSVAGRVLIDKSPLSSVHLGLIEQLFPGARILIMLRHPADVVLSCFMQDFALNPVLANYASLDGVAEVYASVMDTLLAHEQRSTLRYHRVHYEALVARFDDTVGAALDFLGVEWNDAVQDFAEHGKTRGVLNTPSYHQVTTGLYTSAAQRWRRYQAHLAPVLPRLQRFVEAFGYADDD